MRVLRRKGTDARFPHMVLSVLDGNPRIVGKEIRHGGVTIFGVDPERVELASVSNAHGRALLEEIEADQAKIEAGEKVTTWIQWDGTNMERFPNPSNPTGPRKFPPEAGTPEWRHWMGYDTEPPEEPLEAAPLEIGDGGGIGIEDEDVEEEPEPKIEEAPRTWKDLKRLSTR